MYESSGSGFVCFATLSYSDCLCLSKTISIYLHYNSKWHVLLCFLFVFFHVLFFFTCSHFSSSHSFFPYIHTHIVTLSFSSAIFFSQILTLSLSFFCRGNTSIVSVWMQCLTQSECFSLWVIIVFAFSICSLFIRSKNIYGFVIIVWIMIYMSVEFGSGFWWKWWLCLYIQQMFFHLSASFLMWIMAPRRSGEVCVFLGHFPTYFLSVSF